jgi:hypothetical protein
VKPLVTMRRALEDPDLFGSILPGASWASWRVLLIAAMGEELTEAERETFAALTGREKEPLQRVDEFWAIHRPAWRENARNRGSGLLHRGACGLRRYPGARRARIAPN